MKRILFLMTLFALVPYVSAIAEEGRGGKEGGQAQASPARSFTAPSHTQVARPPVVINMSRPAPRANNPQPHPAQRMGNTPSTYSRVQWQANPQPQAVAPRVNQPRTHYVPATHSFTQRPDAAHFVSPGVRAANVLHHHPYTIGYVRKKLQKLGIKNEPSYITDRSQMINTDRAHSTITLPREGPDHAVLNVSVVSPRHFNDPLVLNHMTRINDPAVLGRIDRFNATETQVNHYYWHQDDGFNYCHYLDPYGYHWYGWYLNDQCFWTRYYGDRWWWYDNDWGRWCFWNEGNWWWQDPYHVGDLYCYTNDAYVPCNSAQDQIVMTSPDTPDVKAYQSPDGTRLVKVVNDTQDAFLYDNSPNPSFNPVYLATGVVDVQYSNAQNGRPMEILLKLSDGSFDIYDGEGNAYNPGSFDADQAAQSSSSDVQTAPNGDADPSNPDGQNPPMDNGTTTAPDGTVAP